MDTPETDDRELDDEQARFGDDTPTQPDIQAIGNIVPGDDDPLPADGSDNATPPPAIIATDLSLTADRGPVFGPLTFTVPEGTLAIVVGPAGSGRSSLLLTLAGRMKPSGGSELTVFDHPLPAGRSAVQSLVGVAGFDAIDVLDGAVTVSAAMRERLGLLTPWYRRLPRLSQPDIVRLTAEVFGDLPIPDGSTLVRDLDELDVMLVRIAIALLQRPRLLVVDDVDQVHDDARRTVLWRRLEALTTGGLTVVATVASQDEPGRTPWHTSPQIVALPDPRATRPANHGSVTGPRRHLTTHRAG